MKNFQSGALIDNRTPEEKAKDYKFDEIVAKANPVDWKEKRASEWRSFPVQNQNGSGSCVAQTARKLLRVLIWLKTGRDLDFSASHIYQRRVNKPAGGMGGVDVFEIMKQGVTLNAMMPSDDMSDEEMDGVPTTYFDEKIGEVFKIDNYVQPTPGDFETVASIIQTTGKAVMVWFYFTSAEWSRTIPKIINANLTTYEADASRHSVPAVDFGLKNGKKYIKVEDSAHFAGLTEHFIDEEFFAKRNFFIGYPINFKYSVKETFTVLPITKTLKFGMRSIEVVNLQKMLQERGYFPDNSQTTGYFGAVTLKAVKDFQKAQGLTVDGIVGPNTIEALTI